MEKLRKPFQGTCNVIHFNWHLFVLSLCFCLFLFLVNPYLNDTALFFSYLSMFITGCIIFLSVSITWYVYDISDLYQMSWLRSLKNERPENIVNINAGFDETSELLKRRYEKSTLTILDFYDPLKHKSLSIKVARKAYAPYPNTQKVNSTELFLKDDYADQIYAILSAHEIQNLNERIIFFTELKRILKKEGQIIVVEHIRNTANFIAYNFGFFHFHSRVNWLKTFQNSGLEVKAETNLTPFITIFILEKNGN